MCLRCRQIVLLNKFQKSREIKLQQGSDIFRIFCFFDQGKLVVLANGFHKKTQKTPKKEIELALKIKAEYESEK